jgi:DNA-binding SARP family transcriptional activator
MDFRILGPVEAHSGGHEVTLAGRRQRALLAYLLLHANETVSGHRLLDELWTTPPAGGLAALQTQISRLRKLLDDRIATTRAGYVLRVEPGELDLDRFRSLLAAAGASADAEERARRLREADSLWHGMPLEGLDAPFVAAEAAALEELRLSALEDRVEADLARGLGAELVSELSALVGRYPLRERLRGHLILALYRGGRQAEALGAYRDARRMLDEELGLEPSPALRELERAILRQDPAIDAPEPGAGLVASEPDVEALPRRRRGVSIAVGLAAVAALGIGAAAAVATLLHDERSHAAAPGTSVVYVERNIATTASTTHPADTRTVRPASHSFVHPRTVPRGKAGTTAPATTTHSATTVASATVHHAASKTTPVKTTQRKTAHKPRIVTISDAFDGNQIDGTIWYQIYQGSGWTLSQHDGRLEFAFPAGTTPGGQWDNYGVHVGTLCEFPGDFDARVDFSLPQWPAGNDVLASLWIFFKPNNVGWETFRQSSAQWGERYGGYVGVDHGGSVALDDTSGSMRIARHNGIVTSYFLHDGKWLSLGSNSNPALAVIAVGAGTAENPPVSSAQVTVDFTNFTITGEDPICPVGAQGSA